MAGRRCTITYYPVVRANRSAGCVTAGRRRRDQSPTAQRPRLSGQRRRAAGRAKQHTRRHDVVFDGYVQEATLFEELTLPQTVPRLFVESDPHSGWAFSMIRSALMYRVAMSLISLAPSSFGIRSANQRAYTFIRYHFDSGERVASIRLERTSRVAGSALSISASGAKW